MSNRQKFFDTTVSRLTVIDRMYTRRRWNEARSSETESLNAPGQEERAIEKLTEEEAHNGNGYLYERRVP